jgi:hypothetical protein
MGSCHVSLIALWGSGPDMPDITRSFGFLTASQSSGLEQQLNGLGFTRMRRRFPLSLL